MGAQNHHQQQARENLALAHRLLATERDNPTAVQWAVTLAFYCCVHSVEAHLATLSRHSHNHAHRRAQMRAIGVPLDLRTNYQQLKDWSEHARYQLRRFDPVFVETIVLTEYLRPITEFARL